MDKFYTNNDVVTSLVLLIKKNLNIGTNDLIIEPSAGSGAFSNELLKYYKNVLAFDIEPSSKNIIKQDYLEENLVLKIKKLQEKFRKIHVIGNPPFGRQSCLAKQFIKISCEFCSSISFVLPKSFKKESFIKTFPLNFHKILSVDLPDNSFNYDGNIIDVPCVFVIYVIKDHDRRVPKIIEPTYYEYNEENPDITIRRIGFNSGTIEFYDSKKEYSEGTHYFIKFTRKISIKKFIEVYKNNFNFKFNNTVGPRSISKNELNMYLEKLRNNFF